MSVLYHCSIRGSQSPAISKLNLKVVTDPSLDRGSLAPVALRANPVINGSNVKLAVEYTGADCAATEFDKPTWQDTPKSFPRPQG
jgi:hypothetical protein